MVPNKEHHVSFIFCSVASMHDKITWRKPYERDPVDHLNMSKYLEDVAGVCTNKGEGVMIGELATCRPRKRHGRKRPKNNARTQIFPSFHA